MTERPLILYASKHKVSFIRLHIRVLPLLPLPVRITIYFSSITLSGFKQLESYFRNH